MGIVTNFRVKPQLCHSQLYLVFDATTPGHYDATTEIDFKGYIRYKAITP